jgi:hypothetical protein
LQDSLAKRHGNEKGTDAAPSKTKTVLLAIGVFWLFGLLFGNVSIGSWCRCGSQTFHVPPHTAFAKKEVA